MFELRDLVLHESDERRDDNHGALGVEHGWQLVAERFAPAGGHDDAGVASCGDAADDVLLAGAEGIVAPVAVQGLGEATIRLLGEVLLGDQWRQSCHSSRSWPKLLAFGTQKARAMRLAVFAFISPTVKYYLRYAGVGFQSQVRAHV